MSKKATIKKNILSNSSIKPASTVETTNGISFSIYWLLLTIIILPFLFSTITYDANVPTRFNFLAIAVCIGVLLFFLQKKMAINCTIPKVAWYIIGVSTLYGLWNIVPLLSAINKQEGYFIIARHFLGVLFLLLSIMVFVKNDGAISYVGKALVVIVILQSFIGIAQFYEVGFLKIQGNNSKPVGMMANRNFFGSAQMLLIPFCMYIAYKEKYIWRKIGIASIVLAIFSVIISQTRSAWIATGVIFIVSLILVLSLVPTLRKQWSVAFVATIIGSILLFIFITTTSKDVALANATKDRMTFTIDAQDVQTGASSANERLVMWDMTKKVINKNPLAGVGGGNWKFAVMDYVTTQSPYAIDKRVPEFAHNEYLQIAAEFGLVGLVLYILFWLGIVVIGIITIKKQATTEGKVLLICILSGIAAFASDAFFSFPLSRMEHFVYTTLFAAIVISCYIKSNGNARTTVVPKNFFLLMLPIAIGITVVGFYRHSYQQNFVEARAKYNAKDYDGVVSAFAKAKNNFVTVAPNGMPIENYIGLIEKERKNYKEALRYFDAGLAINPYSMALQMNKGTVYTDMQKFDSAIIFYNKALQLAPKSKMAMANLAINYFYIKDYTKCLAYIKDADMPEDKNLQQLQQLCNQVLQSEVIK